MYVGVRREVQSIVQPTSCAVDPAPERDRGTNGNIVA
jgi:hypothetical protein